MDARSSRPDDQAENIFPVLVEIIWNNIIFATLWNIAGLMIGHNSSLVTLACVKLWSVDNFLQIPDPDAKLNVSRLSSHDIRYEELITYDLSAFNTALF